MFDSQALSASVALSLLGLVSAAAVLLVRQAADFAMRTLRVTASVTNEDQLFAHVLQWAAAQTPLYSSQRLEVSVKSKDKKQGWRAYVATLLNTNVEGEAEATLVPGPGLFVYRWRGRLVFLRRAKGKLLSSGMDRRPTQFETLTLWTPGRDSAPLRELLGEAMALGSREDNGKTSIFCVGDYGSSWDKTVSRDPRPADSVILEADNKETLLADARRFLQAEDWYRARGIPYRRGYLLHGPPGCGKTSFAQVLAGQLGLHICVLTLSSPSLDDQTLNERLHEAPEHSMVLLEDVDSVFVARDSRSRDSGVSFSGLLNAIDGVASQEGRIFVMSTNHLDRLDPALVRPGRVDVKVRFDLASEAQIRALHARFFADEPDAAAALAARVGGGRVSMAQVQGYLMRHRDDAAAALAGVDELLRQAAAVDRRDNLIAAWLRRLGLARYAPCFARAGLFYVEDLKEMGASDLEALGVADDGHRRRMAAMIAGREDLAAEFAHVNPEQARRLFAAAFPAAAPALADDFAALTPPAAVSVAMVQRLCRDHREAGAAAAVAAYPAFLRAAAEPPAAERDVLAEARAPAADFLLAAGLEHRAAQLAAAGITRMEHVWAGGDCGLEDPVEKLRLQQALGSSDGPAPDARRRLYAGWLPHMPALVDELLRRPEPLPSATAVADVPVRDWLAGLNLAKYADKFAAQHVFYVGDLRDVDGNALRDAFGVAHAGDRARIERALKDAPVERIGLLPATAGMAEALGVVPGSVCGGTVFGLWDSLSPAAPEPPAEPEFPPDTPIEDVLSRLEVDAELAPQLREHGFDTAGMLKGVSEKELKEDAGVAQLWARRRLGGVKVSS